MIETSRPVEKRITSFDRKPTDQDLGTDLGYGLVGSSPSIFKDNDKFFQVGPQIIPVKYVAIWMYFVLAVMAIIVFYFGGDKAVWGMIIGAGIIIVPAMIFFAAFISEQTGSDPYLVYDKKAKRVELPRLSLKFSQTQLREVIFLERFVDHSPCCHWQVGLVIEEGNGSWTYLHLFNTGHRCSGSGLGWWGFKDDDQKIAEALGIGHRRLWYTEAESLELASLVPWLDRRS